jgi:hypothetical protein
MTLDKHQLDGIGGFSEKVLSASKFDEIMTNAGYSQTGSAPAQDGRLKVWWSHTNFRNVESIYSGDKAIAITAYHV